MILISFEMYLPSQEETLESMIAEEEEDGEEEEAAADDNDTDTDPKRMMRTQ